MIHGTGAIGAAGAGVTFGAGLVAAATEAIPVLQALSFLIGILVGIATIAWYGYQAYHLRKRREK